VTSLFGLVYKYLAVVLSVTSLFGLVYKYLAVVLAQPKYLVVISNHCHSPSYAFHMIKLCK